MSILKKVRFADQSIRTCHNLTQTGAVSWSTTINSVVGQFELFVNDNIPELTLNEWNAFYCSYNGYFSTDDNQLEAENLPWMISEGYQYDEQITLFIGSEENALAFIERIKSWSLSERLAVIYKAKSYWRQQPIVDREENEEISPLPSWMVHLREREQIGLLRLGLLELEKVNILVNDASFNFPEGSNLSHKSKELIKNHILTL